MTRSPDEARQILLKGLNEEQQAAVSNQSRRLLVVAGAGSGKTEVMARRVAWWVAVEEVPKNQIAAFTFTEAAAEELKFRIRKWLERIALQDEDHTLGGMYIGTIHGFCLKALRELASDEFYMFDVVDEAGRTVLIEQGYNGILALRAFQEVSGKKKFGSQQLFLRGYDLLNEYGLLKVALPRTNPPADVAGEKEWCQLAELETDVGGSDLASAFAESAARYYAYLRARRFLDFSTIQSEVTRRLNSEEDFKEKLRERWTRLVVDEVQDINPVQNALITEIIGESGYLTAVGDHRQAIYSFRGGRVDLMGCLSRELGIASDGHIQELSANYRSTPRIIDLANRWSNTIKDTADMTNPAMRHHKDTRRDISDCHVAQLHFEDHIEESKWIADTISKLVRADEDKTIGAFHDEGDSARGLTLSDIAILVRSGRDIRTYQNALINKGIPAIVRGGPDLFSQPEVLLFLGALAICSDSKIYGEPNNQRSMPGRIRAVLGVAPEANQIVPFAIEKLKQRGLSIPEDTPERLMLLCRSIRHRLGFDSPQPEDISQLKCSPECRRWLTRRKQPRRIFPQTIYHWLLREAGVHRWRTEQNKVIAESTLFHVGQLSSLVKAIETSGWTPTDSLKWQFIALLNWGSGAARASEAPLLVGPDAVSITTIHSAKGLEFGAVFLADVRTRRFPSNFAKRVQQVPFDNDYVDPTRLSDNENLDDERRLMYVALTRAERYLFITASGRPKSPFFEKLSDLVNEVGGTISDQSFDISDTATYLPSTITKDHRLATSFSDLRYYFECPHDFYLRNVLGFTPTIGQEFGYGRGLHNLLRVVHSDPGHWANLAGDRNRLRAAVKSLVDQGMFYLRYTVGDPLQNLQNRAIEGVVQYIETYSDELARLKFEPEKEFETLIPEENLLIAGAIDVIRLDDPPRVSIVDFKSGDASEETGSGLSRELMGLQIGVYGLAARDELEYEPQHGLIRYIGERSAKHRQVEVQLTDDRLTQVRREIIQTGQDIRDRKFDRGPTERIKNRCGSCDFLNFCPRQEAERTRQGSK